MSTTLPILWSNPALPDGRDLSAIIAADPAFLGWICADAEYVTLSGAEILTFTDRTGKPVSFTATGAGSRAVLEADQLAGFQAARCDSDQAAIFDSYLSAGLAAALPTNAACSFAVIFRLDSGGKTQAVLGRYGTATQRCLIQVSSTNAPRMMARNATVTGAPMTVGSFYLVVGSFDGANTARLWHLGAISAGAASAGDSGTGELRLGTLEGAAFQSADMSFSDGIIFGRDLLADPDDETLAAIVEFASSVYGIAVA